MGKTKELPVARPEALSKLQAGQEAGASPMAVTLGNTFRVGLIGGLVAIFIGLTGMMQAFSPRDIIYHVITMSQVLLLLAFFGTGYAAVGRSTGSKALRIVAGVLGGLMASAMVVVLVAVGQVIGLGNVFISATQDMYNQLTFGMGLATGSVFLLVLGAVMGLFAAVIDLLPGLARRAVMTGLIATIAFGLLQDLIKVTLSDWDALTPLLKFVYESNGLSMAGAIVLFVFVTVGVYVWWLRGQAVRDRVDALPAPARRTLRWSSIGLLIILLLILPIIVGLYISDVLDTVGLYLLMGLGLNIVVGFAGLLDLGYVAFYAIGAYTVGMLTSPEVLSRVTSAAHATGILPNWWLALPFGVVAAVVAGVLLGIPVLKMRGDYLAIVTLGFGEIIRYLAISDWLKPWEGGAQGIQGIPTPDIGPIKFAITQLDLPLFGRIQLTPSQMYYYLFLAGCILVIIIASRVKVSRLGRAWMAIREDEDVAQAMGINLVATKLMAFGMGAAFGGLAGSIFASKIQSVYPQSFQFLISVYVLSVIIVGGMGSIPGVIVGALALAGLPELLREVGDFRYLFFGAALVIMMLVRPEGLLPEARRRLELEEKTSEDREAAPMIRNPGQP